MLYDLRDMPASDYAAALGNADICIVGGGIAGLLLAERLSRQSALQILLLEAGGSGPDTTAEDHGRDSLQADSPPGRHGETIVLGGNSTTWGGQLLPLPDCANWPVASSELSTFHGIIEELFHVDHLPYGAERFFCARSQQLPSLLSSIVGTRSSLSKFIPFSHRNLAKTVAQQLRRRPHVRLILHAVVSSVVLAQNGQCVDNLRVVCPGGNMVHVRAKRYVLAAGAVETVRLLLTAWADAGLNPPQALGKGFCNHPTTEVAWFEGGARQRVLRDCAPWVIGGPLGTVHALKWEANADLCESLFLRGAMAHLVFEEPEGTGSAALRTLLRDRQATGGSVGSAPMAALAGAARQVWTTSILGRRYVSPHARVALRVNLVQRTPPSSCIRLGNALDEKGIRPAQLHWEVAPAEMDGIRLFGRHLRSELTKSGLSEASGVHWRVELDRLDEPIEGLDDARHPMGGACMGFVPAESVVDSHLSVHGVHGLYVASTATFPDGSPQLPTLTLMALTLRLGEHLLGEA